MTPGQDLATKGGHRGAAKGDGRAQGRLTKLRIDIAWIKWILTAEVGIYLVRSIAEWISIGWLRF